MKLTTFIRRLRSANGALIGQNVAGAADQDIVMDETYVGRTPAAWIFSAGDTTEEMTDNDGYDQLIVENFGVIVVLDNASDKPGLKAHDQLDAIRDEIFHGLLNWTPPGYESPVYYTGGQLMEMNRKFMWWVFGFSVKRRLDEVSGIDFEDVYGPYCSFLCAWFSLACTMPIAGIVDFTTDEPADPDDGVIYLNTVSGESSETSQTVVGLTLYQWDETNTEWVVYEFTAQGRLALDE